MLASGNSRRVRRRMATTAAITRPMSVRPVTQPSKALPGLHQINTAMAMAVPPATAPPLALKNGARFRRSATAPDRSPIARANTSITTP